MTFYHPFRVPLPAWADWLALALMAIAAPAIAGFIHSFYVLQSGYRLYNAEIGGAYFHGNPAVEPPGLLSVLTFIGACGVPAILTFLVLLPFRRRAFYRWIVWAAFTVLWTWLCFKSEIAYH
jgi:hypothetical protein